ncbi:hypothetical protein [Bacteroides fragilis]|uniref:hypothetical protein n=1 Tax=Bacteroides fragilis TaxID=817 RepID=UPI003703919D
MSLQQVAWLCMQGFTTKYYLCEAERGDFIVNLQVTTLHTIKTWQIPLRHNFHQADRKLICEHVGVYSVRMCVKGVYEVKSIAAKREKRQELIFSFGCMGRMGKSQK